MSLKKRKIYKDQIYPLWSIEGLEKLAMLVTKSDRWIKFKFLKNFQTLGENLSDIVEKIMEENDNDRRLFENGLVLNRSFEETFEKFLSFVILGWKAIGRVLWVKLLCKWPLLGVLEGEFARHCHLRSWKMIW